MCASFVVWIMEYIYYKKINYYCPHLNSCCSFDVLIYLYLFPILFSLVMTSKGEWVVGDTLDTGGLNNEDYKSKYQQQLQV